MPNEFNNFQKRKHIYYGDSGYYLCSLKKGINNKEGMLCKQCRDITSKLLVGSDSRKIRQKLKKLALKKK